MKIISFPSSVLDISFWPLMPAGLLLLRKLKKPEVTQRWRHQISRIIESVWFPCITQGQGRSVSKNKLRVINLDLKLLRRKNHKPTLPKDTNTCFLSTPSNFLHHFNQLLKFPIPWKKMGEILNLRNSFILTFIADFHFMLICFHIICGTWVLQQSSIPLFLGLWGGPSVRGLGNLRSLLTHHHTVQNGKATSKEPRGGV